MVWIGRLPVAGHHCQTNHVETHAPLFGPRLPAPTGNLLVLPPAFAFTELGSPGIYQAALRQRLNQVGVFNNVLVMLT